MEYIIYIALFIITVMMTAIVFSFISNRKTLIQTRLVSIQKIQASDAETGEFHEPFWDRVIRPFYLRVLSGIGSLTPKSLKLKYDHLIITSGESKKLTFNSVVFIQFLMSCVVSGILYIFYRYSGRNMAPFVLMLAFILGFFLPILLLSSSAKKRKEQIRRELPDLLDLIYISVEAGLGFDLALKRSTDKMKGILSDEIKRTLSEILKGRDRIEALRSLEKRTGVDELTSFVTAVIQTEQLGSNIANMLRIQSVTMRVRRRQHAEEKAAKMGIKMLFPLIFFIFPALFVVILGPAIINIYENFISVNW